MLKTTYKASDAPPPSTKSDAPPSLPDGWTEHKAPSGHTYYYHAATKKSTYKRPTEHESNERAAAGTAAPPPPPPNPSMSFMQHQAVGDPQHISQSESAFAAGSTRKDQGGRSSQRRPPRTEPEDKPKSREAIPGCEPWVLVHTKYGRRFAYNAEKNQSFWRIPEKLMQGVLALDKERIRAKAEALVKSRSGPGQAEALPRVLATFQHEDGYESEYEEVEVTDDEGAGDGQPSKRPRTDADDGQVEFTEDDIAFQLAAMNHGEEQPEDEYWDDDAGDYALSQEDANALFKDLLNDTGINPYSPWEKIVEDGKMVDDTRYTVLTSMKARRAVWEEWARTKIQWLREKRAKEETKDPRIPYLALLQQHATPKLYWPEFKRKYKKEASMRSTSLSDKEREKLYREHIQRLKLPRSTLTSDLSALLKSQPPRQLNNATLASDLPSGVLSDLRYISLDAAVRDPLVEAFIATLAPPPATDEEEESEEAARERRERERRQTALEERERKVAEDKRRQRRNLEYSKNRLQEEEMEIDRAMQVTKKGLLGHLVTEETADESADG